MISRFLGLFAAATLLIACGGPQESASMKEAKAVHEQLTRISDELHDAIFDAMAPLEEQIDSAMVAGDTLMAAQLAKLEGKLDRIHVRFHDWSETVTEIPGQLVLMTTATITTAMTMATTTATTMGRPCPTG